MTGSGNKEEPNREGEGHIQRDEKKHTVHWFRKGLRLHDNPSLRESLNGATTFRCVFLVDPWFAGTSVGINKWRYIFPQFSSSGSHIYIKMLKLLFC